MLSFPRDLMVDIHCPGRIVLGPDQRRVRRLRPAGTVETVKQMTGLPIHYLVTIDYRGFIQTVDKLGGVWMDIDRRYFNDNSGGGPTFPPIDLQPGYQELTGRQALVRPLPAHRLRPLPNRAPAAVHARDQGAALELVQGDGDPQAHRRRAQERQDRQGRRQGARARRDSAWALFALQLPPGRVYQSKIEGLSGYNQLTTDPANIQSAVEEFQTPDVDAGEEGDRRRIGAAAEARRSPRRPRVGPRSSP